MEDLPDALGLRAHQKKLPAQLSGGQQQRCAIARALIKNPKLLCHDPTGVLDSGTSRDILILLEEVNRKHGTTLEQIEHASSVSVELMGPMVWTMPGASALIFAIVMYLMLISNVACGMDLPLPKSWYAVIYGGIPALYLITNRMLTGYIGRIVPAEVLKNRE